MAAWIKLAFDHREPIFEFLEIPERAFNFGLSLGLPIGAKRMPVKAKQINVRKRLPDIFVMPGLNAVSQRFRDLVEEFEPGTHQFFPLELYYKNGTPVEEPFFVFNCCVSFDSLLVSRSEVKWHGLGEPLRSPNLGVLWRHRNVLSRPAIAGHHIWCSLRLRVAGLYVSDVFHDQMKRRKIRYFDASPCEESEEPWIAEENAGPILEWEARHGLEKGMMPWLVENPDVLF